MNAENLILYTRKGCCLCEALEERLRSIPLADLEPSLSLSIVDIDGLDVTETERMHYSLEVPVMVINSSKRSRNIQMPRVSPRLKGSSLFNWLQKILDKIY